MNWTDTAGRSKWFSASRITWIVAAILLLAFGYWLMPKRGRDVVSLDGKYRWEMDSAPLRRQMIWEPAVQIDPFGAEIGAGDSLARPQLADNGNSLYFTLRKDEGGADIYRSQLVDNKWQPAEPVGELNSAADDFGPVIRADGQELLLYSNRDGGHGGFDIYLSQRTADGWTEPRNLGPYVNSPAHEYDPAISPNGKLLYFASNRSPRMQALVASGELADGPNPWTATLRADLALNKFDIYRAVRPAGKTTDEAASEKWQDVSPLTALNLENSNEGAPYVDADSLFLYFVSDRAYRGGEDTNFDIYRARIADSGIGPVENLGPGVNSPGNEIEPALSASGYELYFSRNELAQSQKLTSTEKYSLYQSRAIETEEIASWDDGNLRALVGFFGDHWWWLLTLLLLAALLAALIWAFRRFSLRRIQIPTYLLIALIIHILLGMGTFFVYFGEDLVAGIKQQFGETIIAEVTLSDTHQSHEKGLENYEKLADVDVETVQPTDVSRQNIETANVPIPTETAIPRITTQLFAEDLPEVAESVPTPTVQQVELVRDSKVEMFEETEMVEFEQTEVREQVSEQQTKRSDVELVREELSMKESAAPELPRFAPPTTNAIEAEMVDAVDIDDSELPATQPQENQLVRTVPVEIPATEMERVATDVAFPESMDADVKPKTEMPSTVAVKIDRQPETGAAPAAFTPTDLNPLEKAAASLIAASSALDRPESAQAIPATQQSETELVRAEFISSVDSLDAIPTEAPAAMPASPPSAASSSAKAVEVSIDRLPSQLPNAPAKSTEPVGGPHNPERDDLLLGGLSKKVVDAPLAFGTVNSLLDLPPARAPEVKYAEDAIKLQTLLVRRQMDQKQKQEVIVKFGGDDKVPEAIQRSLSWIAMHQHEDGRWSLDKFHECCKHEDKQNCNGQGKAADTAATGFALLPFLGDGNTHLVGEHQQSVARAISWLLSIQRADGALWTGGDTNSQMYSHGIAAIALCEAYGMSDDPKLREPAQRAINFIVASQAKNGGWRYVPGDPNGDTSVLGWQVMALKSGQIADLYVPEQTLQQAEKWLAVVQAEGNKLGQFGYQNKGDTKPAMSAEALLCLAYLGVDRADPRVEAGGKFLLQNLPADGKENSYYWYYGTQIMFHLQGDYWKQWEKSMRETLLATQRVDGNMAGTWDPKDQWEGSGGRLYSTALRVLMLEVYYRHLPLYQPL